MLKFYSVPEIAVYRHQWIHMKKKNIFQQIMGLSLYMKSCVYYSTIIVLVCYNDSVLKFSNFKWVKIATQCYNYIFYFKMKNNSKVPIEFKASLDSANFENKKELEYKRFENLEKSSFHPIISNILT